MPVTAYHTSCPKITAGRCTRNDVSLGITLYRKAHAFDLRVQVAKSIKRLPASRRGSQVAFPHSDRLLQTLVPPQSCHVPNRVLHSLLQLCALVEAYQDSRGKLTGDHKSTSSSRLCRLLLTPTPLTSRQIIVESPPPAVVSPPVASQTPPAHRNHPTYSRAPSRPHSIVQFFFTHSATRCHAHYPSTMRFTRAASLQRLLLLNEPARLFPRSNLYDLRFKHHSICCRDAHPSTHPSPATHACDEARVLLVLIASTEMSPMR